MMMTMMTMMMIVSQFQTFQPLHVEPGRRQAQARLWQHVMVLHLDCNHYLNHYHKEYVDTMMITNWPLTLTWTWFSIAPALQTNTPPSLLVRSWKFRYDTIPYLLFVYKYISKSSFQIQNVIVITLGIGVNCQVFGKNWSSSNVRLNCWLKIKIYSYIFHWN